MHDPPEDKVIFMEPAEQINDVQRELYEELIQELEVIKKEHKSCRRKNNESNVQNSSLKDQLDDLLKSKEVTDDKDRII